MPFQPRYENEFPTLGHYVLGWVYEYLKPPAGVEEHMKFTREQAEFVLRMYELDPVTGRRIIRRAVMSRPRGWGKALALDTRVPTPSGWTTMGQVRPGDQVYDERGLPCRVLNKSQVWQGTDCYEVTFSDGQTVVASGDHLWTVRNPDRHRLQTLDTRELKRTHIRSARGDARYTVASPGPLQCVPAKLELDPYVLGYWLGDGDSDAGRVTSADDECLDAIRQAGFAVKRTERYRASVYGLVTYLRNLGVYKHKHIPSKYLRASIDQRWSLLQGLMDSDGTTEVNGRCEYTSTNQKLASDVGELLASLGIKYNVAASQARIYGKDWGTRWRIRFCAKNDTPVFRLKRKQSRLPAPTGKRELYKTRRIVRVEECASVPTVCIEVDSTSHLFLVGERMVPTHNSPLAGSLALAEGLADVVFDGWDSNGRPVGKPWYTKFPPSVEIFAVSEPQVRSNTYLPMLRMVTDRLMDEYGGVGFEPMETFVALPGDGRISVKTTSSKSAKGSLPVFGVADQSEAMTNGNGGTNMMDTMLTNLSKQGGCLLETPNAYVREPSEYASQAQRTHEDMKAIAEGRSRKVRNDVLWDHREAPPETDMGDLESLTKGLRISYGDSSGHADGCVLHDPPCAPGWVDLEDRVNRIWDASVNPDLARSDFLNQIEASSGGWMSVPAWRKQKVEDREIPDGTQIVLGFDGSRGNSDDAYIASKPDATALVAMTLDGHVFLPGDTIWEAPPDKTRWRAWEPPTDVIDAAVNYCKERWTVVGFYGDPAKGWAEWLYRQEAELHDTLVAKVSAAHPCTFWMTGATSARVDRAVMAAYQGVVGGNITHDGAYWLTEHILAAKQVNTNGKVKLEKESKHSPKKIDAAIAFVLANQARLDAIAAGAGIVIPQQDMTITKIRRRVY